MCYVVGEDTDNGEFDANYIANLKNLKFYIYKINSLIAFNIPFVYYFLYYVVGGEQRQ